MTKTLNSNVENSEHRPIIAGGGKAAQDTEISLFSAPVSLYWPVS